MALILLRHPRPDIADGICYGATDMGCVDDPKSMAEIAIASLSPIDRIVSSPLRRCADVARAIANRLDLSVAIDDRLREMDFGRWEGRAWTDIDRQEIDVWAADFTDARPHDGESVAMVAARVVNVLDELRKLGGVTLVVTHLGVIRAALVANGREDGWQARIGFGESVTLSREHE